MWLSNIGDSSSRMIGMGIKSRMIGMRIKTDSKMLLKSGSKTGVNIDLGIWTGSQIWGSKSHSGSGSEIELPSWGSGSYSYSSSISQKG